MASKGSSFSFKLIRAKEDKTSPNYSDSILESESNDASFQDSAPEDQQKSSEDKKSIPQKGLPHFLLIEDNTIALRMLESIVQQVGCQFTSTMDAEEAFNLVKKTKFDLIITDIGLPGMSGIELTIYIRHWEQVVNHDPIPIVGLTAHSLGSSVDECLEAGMNKVFAKPINLATMKEIVATLIPNNQLESQTSLFDQEILPDGNELFNLTQFPLFDIQKGLNNFGSKELLKELLTLMVNEDIPKNKIKIQQAYEAKDWETVEKLALKMKSSALYCGTTRLQYACQYLEGYQKTDRYDLLEKLYSQLMEVLEKTRHAITNWLQQ